MGKFIFGVRIFFFGMVFERNSGKFPMTSFCDNSTWMTSRSHFLQEILQLDLTISRMKTKFHQVSPSWLDVGCFFGEQNRIPSGKGFYVFIF